MEKESHPIAQNLLKEQKKVRLDRIGFFPKNISFFRFLALIFIVLTVVILGVFKIQEFVVRDKTNRELQQSQKETPEDKECGLGCGARYFVGTKYYHQSESGVVKLLVIEGIVTEVNLSAGYIRLENNGVTENLPVVENDQYQLMVPDVNAGGQLPFAFENITPDQIRVGDMVSYNSKTDGTHRWIIQRQ